jgi:hypothetical protein
MCLDFSGNGSIEIAIKMKLNVHRRVIQVPALVVSEL